MTTSHDGFLAQCAGWSVLPTVSRYPTYWDADTAAAVHAHMKLRDVDVRLTALHRRSTLHKRQVWQFQWDMLYAQHTLGLLDPEVLQKQLRKQEAAYVFAAAFLMWGTQSYDLALKKSKTQVRTYTAAREAVGERTMFVESDINKQNIVLFLPLLASARIRAQLLESVRTMLDHVGKIHDSQVRDPTLKVKKEWERQMLELLYNPVQTTRTSRPYVKLPALEAPALVAPALVAPVAPVALVAPVTPMPAVLLPQVAPLPALLVPPPLPPPPPALWSAPAPARPVPNLALCGGEDDPLAPEGEDVWWAEWDGDSMDNIPLNFSAAPSRAHTPPTPRPHTPWTPSAYTPSTPRTPRTPRLYTSPLTPSADTPPPTDTLPPTLRARTPPPAIPHGMPTDFAPDPDAVKHEEYDEDEYSMIRLV